MLTGGAQQNQEIDPHKYSQLILTKVYGQFNGENTMLEKWDIHMQKIVKKSLNLIFTIYVKIGLR